MCRRKASLWVGVQGGSTPRLQDPGMGVAEGQDGASPLSNSTAQAAGAGARV